MLKIVLTVIGLVLGFEFATLALNLMSEPSTFDFYCGLGIILGLILLLGVIVKRNLKAVGFLAILVLGLSLSACTTIAPGHVGIKINQFGSGRGVEDYPAVTGLVWYNPWKYDIVEYPVFVQNATWTKSPTEGSTDNEEISFNNADQMTIYADISISYQLEQDKAPSFYTKFRADDIKSWTHGYLRNTTRQKFDEIAGKYKIEVIMGDNAAFLKEVKAAVQTEVLPFGIVIGPIGFIGSPRPPAAVVESIEMKVRATQEAIKVENQIRQTKAQAEKDVAEAQGYAAAAIAKAEGEAKANQIVNSSITPALLEWRKLDISNNTVSKWNGVMPQYSAGQLPFITLPTGK